MSWFNELALKIRKSKLVDLGFCRNQWVWFHILFGALLFNGLVALNVVWWASALITIVLACLWEFAEYYIENDGQMGKIIMNYGSKEKWKYDTIGDILGVVLVVLISLIGLLL